MPAEEMADVEVEAEAMEDEEVEDEDDLVEVTMTEEKGEAKKDEKVEVEAKAAETKVAESTAPAKVASSKPVVAVVEELEKDEPADKGKKQNLEEEVTISTADTTLDVFFDADRGILSSLSDGGFRYLLSGARANTGALSGRYLFEVQVLESFTDSDVRLKIGFSTARSSLFIGEDNENSFGFDLNGGFFAEGKKTPVGKKMDKKVVGILLNVDKESPNANTVSLFLDGVRAGKPQAIPAALTGKALYPTLTFMNVTVAVNFGRASRLFKALPFKCKMLGDISKDKSEQNGFKRAKDGSFQVVFPVGLAGQGIFDFVDKFCADHPEFEELSRRRLLQWCKASGLEPQEASPSAKASLDAPDFSFGLDGLSDRSMLPMLETLVHLARRDVIVCEVCAGMLKDRRSQMLSKLPAIARTSAIVVIGEPAASFKQWVHEKIKAGNDKAAVDESVWYLPRAPGALPDVADRVVSQSYAKFSLPAEDEGFGKVEYQWLAKEAAEAHLKKWVLERKATTLIEDLAPGEWFTTKLKAWHSLRSEVQKRHMEYSKKRKETPELDAAANFDIKGVTIEDIHNVDAKGTPIYANFKYEDWVLLAWRYELHLLFHAFAADVNDSDRPGIPEDHLPHYYKIYFKAAFDPSKLGVDSTQKVFKVLKLPALQLVDKGGKSKILSSELGKETVLKDFIVDVETYRRNRLRRIDAGDESAQLKFPKPAAKAKADAPKAPNAPKAGVAPGKAATPPKKPTPPKAVSVNPAAAAAAGVGAVKRPAPPQAPPPGGMAKRPRVDGETAPQAPVPQGKPAVAKVPVGKSPVAKAPVAKAPIGKAPIAKRPGPAA